MGIDYRASSSVGYEIDITDEIEDIEEMEDGLEEYADNEIGDEFECFVTGNAYSDEITGTYLGLKEPFKNGLDLTLMKEKLDKELKRIKVKAVSDFGVIGGLYIY